MSNESSIAADRGSGFSAGLGQLPRAWIGPSWQTMPNEIYVAWAQQYPDDAKHFEPLYDKATLDAECDALRQDAERWRAALSAYERGVVMSHDGRTGEKDGYITLFLQALKEKR